MAAYPFMIQTAWNVLRPVLDQWQNEPFRWARERGLQAEIGGRLNQVFSLQGLGTVTGSYGHLLPEYPEDIQSWARVAYEPRVPYKFNEGKYNCFPDIVIWDDFDGIPDYLNDEIWPIAWACELKYGSNNYGEWDMEKLRLLIDQKKVTYGCSVNVQFSRTAKGIGVAWKTHEEFGHKLWQCLVQSPPLEKPEQEAI